MPPTVPPTTLKSPAAPARPRRTPAPAPHETILVTGCAGFIGSHLCERLLAEGYRVVGLDNFDPFYPAATKRANLAGCLAHPRFRFHEGDLLAGHDALAALLAGEAVAAVAHLAAKPGIGPSVRQPVSSLQTNVLGTAHLLEWMQLTGVRKLFFASSSSVYGDTARRPFREDEPLLASCLSPYAASKLAGEQLTATYHHLYGLDVLNARFFTVYGPRQRPDLAIHKFARLLRAGQPLPVYGAGHTARDYTYVGDTVAGISRGLRYLLDHAGVYETLNLGNRKPVPLLRLIGALGRALGVRPQLNFQPEQPGDTQVTYADNGKAQRLVGYAPRTSLAEGLRQFVAWFDAVPAPERPAEAPAQANGVVLSEHTTPRFPDSVEKVS